MDRSNVVNRGRVFGIVQAAMIVLFFGAGIAKLSGMPAMVELFDQIGMGQWCRYAVGAAELLGAVMLTVPRVAGLGALWLGGIMLGAIAVEAVVLAIPPVVPLTVLVLLALVAWRRRADIAGAMALVRAPRRGRRARAAAAGAPPVETRGPAAVPSRRVSDHP